jgi:hypothetical protein
MQKTLHMNLDLDLALLIFIFVIIPTNYMDYGLWIMKDTQTTQATQTNKLTLTRPHTTALGYRRKPQVATSPNRHHNPPPGGWLWLGAGWRARHLIQAHVHSTNARGAI